MTVGTTENLTRQSNKEPTCQNSHYSYQLDKHPTRKLHGKGKAHFNTVAHVLSHSEDSIINH